VPGGDSASGAPAVATTTGRRTGDQKGTTAVIPKDLRYTSDHEWVRLGDRIVVGITDFAQAALGDIVFVQLPEVGERFEAREVLGEVESTKSVSEFYTPVAGRVVARNEDLADEPEMVNTDPYGDGWLVEIEPSSPIDLDELLDAAAYEELTLP
jgi:glycine cleavage system H protein